MLSAARPAWYPVGIVTTLIRRHSHESAGAGVHRPPAAPARVAWTTLALLVAAFALILPRVALATLPGDLCTGNPCNVTATLTVDAGSDLDFGPATDLRLKGTAVLRVGTAAAGARSLRLAARSIVLEPGARILGDGDDAFVALAATGGAIELQSSGSTLSRIDVSGLIAGIVDLRTTGDVLIAGMLDAHGAGDDAVGGEVTIAAQGGVTISRDPELGASGRFAAGGELTISAVGDVSIDAIVDGVAPGDGANVTVLSETGNIAITRKIDLSGGSPDGSGGSLELTARAGSVSIAGPIVGNGGTGEEEACGDGSELTITARRAVTFAAPVTLSGGTQCSGGTISVVAGTTVTQQLGDDMVARGPGTFGGGGQLRIEADGDVTLRNIDLGSPGAGGIVDVRSAGGIITLLGTLDAHATGAESIGGVVEMSACSVAIASTGKVDARGAFGAPGIGSIRLKASTALTVAGTLFAKTANELVVRSGAPVVSGTVTPAPLITVDPGLPPCGECGNGTLESGEICDDDNIADCDGCQGDCRRVDDVCGDGVVECGEQCDDGNTAPGDGCEPDCTPTPTDGSGVRFVGTLRQTSGCLAEWEVALEDPVINSTYGLPDVHQHCIDGDPTCDTDGRNNLSCSFDLRVCLRVTDPRIPACVAEPIEYVTLKSPGSITSGTPVDAANAAAIVGALEALGGQVRIGTTTLQSGPPLAQPDNCTAHFNVTVPRSAISSGERYFNMVAHDISGRTMGSNQMRLACVPNPAVCGNAVPELGEECDDGNALTCDGCTPGCHREFCGDGVVQCDEECDDGPANGTSGDRCSATCTELPPPLRIPGGGPKAADCALEWAPELPAAGVATSSSGLPKTLQQCRDNDPACDFDPAPGACRIRVWACLGGDDARLACSASPVGSREVLSPSARSVGTPRATRLALDQALQAVAFPAGPGESCTKRVDFSVPLGSKGVTLRTRVRAVGSPVVDNDTLRVRCVSP